MVSHQYPDNINYLRTWAGCITCGHIHIKYMDKGSLTGSYLANPLEVIWACYLSPWLINC